MACVPCSKIPTPFHMKLRLVFSIIGFFVGLSIFFTFGFVYRNWHVAVWGLASGVYAGMTTFVHHQYLKNQWAGFDSSVLLAFTAVGAVGDVAGAIAAPFYIATAAIEGQSLSADSLYLAAVWVFMTLKWSWALTLYSNGYRAIVLHGYEEILNEGSVGRKI